MNDQKSIVLLGVDTDLFKACFMEKEEEWASHALISLDSESDTAANDLSKALKEPEVCSVVFQETELDISLISTLRKYYNSGGLVVFFGIYGVFSDPSTLSKQFDFPEAWNFSAYTKHKYDLTFTAMSHLGWRVQDQQYTKCNLLRVPVQDRWMVPKAPPLHQYIEEHAGSLDGNSPSEEWKRDAEVAKAAYLEYCDGLYAQCPLAVHKNENGGKLAYLGFVNGDGNIPYIVRGVVTNRKDNF